MRLQIASDNKSTLQPARGETAHTDGRKGNRRVSGALKPAASGRWDSLTYLLGCSSRGRKTLISNLCCLVDYLRTGKAKGVNPERKSGVGDPKAVHCRLDYALAPPTAALVPNYIGLSVPFDPLVTRRGGLYYLGVSLVSILHRPGMCPPHTKQQASTHLHLTRGEDTPSLPRRCPGMDTTRDVAVTSYKPLLNWRKTRR